MNTEWLVGANGLFCGAPGGQWTPVGPCSFTVNGFVQRDSGIVLGGDTGLWEIAQGQDRWVQWHDETMTSILALDMAPVGVGVVVASAYGVATGELDDLGTVRWAWHSDDLTVNERYCNALLIDVNDNWRWVVGTEAGVLVREHAGDRWVRSSLLGRPVRALCWAMGAFWAGVDGGGVWKSEDGVHWVRAGRGLEGVIVYSLAWTGDGLIAGTEGGVVAGDGVGSWVKSGAPLRVRTVAAKGEAWLAGASPGGLWWSDDRGRRWQKTGHFESVRSLSVREE